MRNVTLSDGDRSIAFAADPSTGFWLVDFKPPLVPRTHTFAESADSEGRRRQRSRPGPVPCALKVGLGDDNPTDFQDHIDNLHELIESINDRGGTLTLEQAVGDDITWDIETADATGLPGVESSTFRANVVEAEIDLELRPYGRLPSQSLVTNDAIGANVDYFLVESVPGQIRAWAELTLTEMSSQDRRHIEVGVEEDVDPDNLAPLALNIDNGDLVTTGYAGSSTTRSGSVSTNVVRATLTTNPVVICSTGSQPHKGRWRVRSRIYGASIADGAYVYVRLAWRVGDAPFTREPWVRLPAENGWYDPLLAVLDIAEVPSGQHSWEALVEGYVSSGTATCDVDQVGAMPAANYTAMRGGVPGEFVRDMYDTFAAASGALAGDTASSGDAWSHIGGSSDTDDFQAASGDAVERTAVSDTNTSVRNGRCNLLGGSIVGDVRVDVTLDASAANAAWQGVVARAVDNSNFAVASMARVTGGYQVKMQHVVGGAVTTLDSETVSETWSSHRLLLEILESGDWRVLVDDVENLSGTAAVFARGQTLADGSVGLFDWCSIPGTHTRTYTEFEQQAPEDRVALFSGSDLLLTESEALRESEDGYFMGRVPVVRGQYLTLAPATRANRVSRIVVKARRGDVDEGGVDLGTADTLTANLDVTPRVLTVSQVLA